MENKDWTGNYNSIYTSIGASNHSAGEREVNDFYATDPRAIDLLMQAGYKFPSQNILEPSCGAGHLSERLKDYGYEVTSYDIVDRGYGDGIKNFFDVKEFDGSICTNPPYKYAKEFVEHGLNIIPEGQQVVMFLKLTFLESENRRELFSGGVLKTLYVATKRIICAKNADFEHYTSSAVAYGWFVFEKGYDGIAQIKWL